LKKILIVDDEISNRDILVKVLKKENFETFEAVDGFEAIELLRGTQYDMVLLDIMMPKINGFNVIKHIRQELHSSIRIVMLSALSDEVSVDKAMNLGADSYITKPINLPNMLKEIRSLLH
jgi:DNA-binding response OmpR family regulator